MMNDISKALTIAGSDCSGGAGIQADLKTMTALKVYGMSVITALTAQNTTGVKSVSGVLAEFVGAQLDAVCQDIMPDAVKIGMLYSEPVISVVAEKIKKYNLKNIVLDTVLVATSGDSLIMPDAVKALAESLFKYAKIITPNIPEAEVLSGIKIKNDKDRIAAGKLLFQKYGMAVLIKGGHSIDCENKVAFENAQMIDMLYYDNNKIKSHKENYTGKCKDNSIVNNNTIKNIDAGEQIEVKDIKIKDVSVKYDNTDNNIVWFSGKSIKTKNTHGTGCTLSSAIASYLALGNELVPAIALAKDYLTKAIETEIDIGSGKGPVNHCFGL